MFEDGLNYTKKNTKDTHIHTNLKLRHIIFFWVHNTNCLFINTFDNYQTIMHTVS